jgi:hypothetical protein
VADECHILRTIEHFPELTYYNYLSNNQCFTKIIANLEIIKIILYYHIKHHPGIILSDLARFLEIPVEIDYHLTTENFLYLMEEDNKYSIRRENYGINTVYYVNDQNFYDQIITDELYNDINMNSVNRFNTIDNSYNETNTNLNNRSDIHMNNYINNNYLFSRLSRPIINNNRINYFRRMMRRNTRITSTTVNPNVYIKYIYEYLKLTYKNVWMCNDIPKEELLYFNFIKNNNTGIDILIKVDNKLLVIKCINSNENINISLLSNFYQSIATYNLNGLVYYDGILSTDIITNGSIKYEELPFTQLRNDSFKISECIVCLENVTLVAFYDCSHYMCKDCYIGWKTNSSYNNCPMCRKAIPKLDVISDMILI